MNKGKGAVSEANVPGEGSRRGTSTGIASGRETLVSLRGGTPHTPVLLQEVIQYLNVASGKQFIDATLDGAGHAREILARYPDVRLMGIEFDPDEVRELRHTDPTLVEKIILVNESFAHIERVAGEHSIQPDGIFFDLGVSSWHYESSGRGFTFSKDEPLDMRFNPEKQGTNAATIVHTWDEKDLERILTEFGEERYAAQIAARITHVRRETPIVSTVQLIQVIMDAVPEWYKHRKIHPATKTFQALRVAVNDELETIRSGLQGAIRILKPGGRLVVISFHGLEDKTVRQVFKESVERGEMKWVTKDTIKPAWEEVQRNPRSRSAKMKIAEKL